jgi:hypothetical protein
MILELRGLSVADRKPLSESSKEKDDPDAHRDGDGPYLSTSLGRVPVSDDTPLRLEEASKIAFPTGSMTASGLLREAKRGKLGVEKIAGKFFTTLNDINEMRRLCRVPEKAPGSGYGPREGTRPAGSSNAPHGSSGTARSMSPRDALAIRLRKLKKS